MEYACARIYYLSNCCAIIASIVNSLSKINPVYIHSQIKTGPSLLILHNLTWEDITLKCDNTYIFYIFFYRGFLMEYYFYWPSSVPVCKIGQYILCICSLVVMQNSLICCTTYYSLSFKFVLVVLACSVFLRRLLKL